MKKMLSPPSTVYSKILLISAVPVLVVSIALTWYYIGERRTDQLNTLQQIGQSATNYLASSSRLAMYANDTENLQQLAGGLSEYSHVYRVSFFRKDMTEVLAIDSSGENAAPPLPGAKQWHADEHRDDLFWHFRSTIQLEAEPISDYFDMEVPGQVLGSVVVSISLAELNAAYRKNVLVGSTISIVIVLLAITVAGLLSRQIYLPIRDLTRTVERMDSGDLSIEADIAGDRDFQILARVINRMASNIRETNTRLKKEVDLATTDLRKAVEDIEERNSELTVIRDELEDALGAKDQFLARMSHELRTPLTTVIGFTRRLENTTLNAEQSEYRHAIHHASLMLLSVINDILDFSRLQYNGIELEEIEFELEKEMEDIISMHAHNACEKGLELVLFIDSDVPRRLLGDSLRLKQIINNLLSNSIKFTDAGEIILHVKQCDPDQAIGAATLEISVRDSGIGITVADVEKLFKPFAQADTSISRRFGGSGLGLVICKQLTELMGGQIGISSEEHEGTTATFSIPLKPTGDLESEVSLPRRSDSVAIVGENMWSRRALRNQVTHWTRQVYAVATIREFKQLTDTHSLKFSTVLVNLGPASREEQYCLDTVSAIRQCYQGPVLLLFCPPDTDSSLPQLLQREFSPAWCLPKPARRKALLKYLDEINNMGAPSESSAEHSLKVEAADLRGGRLQGVEILIAEDNKFNQRLLESLLESEGAKVIIAENGSQALERFKESTPSHVIMDAHMPLVDGIQACREIMSEAGRSRRQVSIIGLTADTLEPERERFLQAGAMDVLYKPIDEASLIKTLCQYAGRVYEEQSDSSHSTVHTMQAELKSELVKQTQSLRLSLAEGQLDAAREVVHQLLGLAGIHGAVNAQACIAEIQKSLAADPEAPLEEQLDTLDAILDEMEVQAKT